MYVFITQQRMKAIAITTTTATSNKTFVAQSNICRIFNTSLTQQTEKSQPQPRPQPQAQFNLLDEVHTGGVWLNRTMLFQEFKKLSWKI